jgi:tetratricopeptide (TPR) repeat protein
LDCQFSGEIEGSGRLEIGSSALAKGRIAVDELIHHGKSEGDLIAADRLTLRPGCHHRGEIEAHRVQISPEACLEGVLKMPDSNPDASPDPHRRRRRKQFAAGVFILLFMGAPRIWQVLESRLSRVGGLVQSLGKSPRNSAEAKKSERQERMVKEALRLEKEGKIPEAANLLAEVVKADGDQNHLAQFRLAKYFARMGRPADAIAQLNFLLVKVPGHIEGRILLGDIHAGSERLKKAALAYVEAIRFDPADVVLRRRLEGVRARLSAEKLSEAGVIKPPPADSILNRAERLLGEKKPVQAAKILRAAISRLPGNPRLYFHLGTALAEISDRTGAIKAFRKVIELSPDWLDAYLRLGALLEANWRDKEAVALYERAAALHPSNVEMLVRIALLEKQRGRRDKAYRMLLKLKKENPRSTVVLLELGSLLWESGKADEAKIVFREVLELEPGSAPALNRLAWFHVVDGNNFERGIEYSKRSLEIRPDTAAYLDTLAELYYRSKQPVKSIPLIQRAIELEPSNRYYRVQLDKFKRASR